VNLKDALKKAYAAQGKPLPAPDEAVRNRVLTMQSAKGQIHQITVNYGNAEGCRASRPQSRADKAIQTGKGNALGAAAKGVPAKDSGNSKPVAGPITVAAPKPLQTLQAVPVKSTPKVRLSAGAKFLVSQSDNASPARLLALDLSVGCKESVHQIARPETHELALGLDFGTSTVKVVIGDLSSDKSYAVPFLKCEGLDAYLLPSRVYELTATSAGTRSFGLEGGELAFRDLKLSLLASPDSIDRQLEVIAFLSLVIKRARAWFFHTHHTIYKRVKCLWQLRIGLPAATALNNKFVPLLEGILRAAWQLASYEGAPERARVLQIQTKAFSELATEDGPEVRVIPEIAAQIFGFVVSSSFDKKAANRYLMVDVGAGTVDASLFKVFPGRGGQWHFEFYTAVVQPFGVANLHAHRVDWWLSILAEVEDSGGLLGELRASKFVTDFRSKLPEHNKNYFSGVHINVGDPNNADAEFFDKKLIAQVQGSTLWRAVHDGFLTKEDMKGMPMFLCGGGSRSPFYQALEGKLQKMPGYSWLSTEAWQLGFPHDLEVDGVDEGDFDRLSVAYGLSKANVGQITQALPLPKVPIEHQTAFTDRYIDKDQI